MTTPTLTAHCHQFSPFCKNAVFAELLHALEAELHPVGMLEILHAAEIVFAHWRLRNLNQADTTTLGETALQSLDLTRTRTKTMLRRDMAELRRLQTERQVRAEIGSGLTGLASTRDLVEIARAVRTAPANGKNEPNGKHDDPEIARLEALIHARLQEEESGRRPSATSTPQDLKIRTQSVPRNAPCPCHSGRKFKQCCGHWSKTMQKATA